MDDTFIIIIIIFAICYILFSMYKKDYFIVQPHNNTIHHLPYNHYEPPNIYILGRNKGDIINKSDNINKGDNNTLTLNDIDDIIHNYENIGYTNNKSEIKRNNNKREEIDNVINFNKHQIENRNISKYRNCDININNKE